MSAAVEAETDTARSRRPSNTVLRAALVLVVVLGSLTIGIWLWARPRDDVSPPTSDSTPLEVVTTYLDAINARDFETSNKIPLPEHHDGLWSRPGTWGNVHDLRLTEPDHHDAHVIFSFTPHGVGGFAGGDEEIFGFYLDRINGQWRITGYDVA